MESRKEVVETLSNRLDRDFYKDAPDALGLVDLTPAALGVDSDPIRVMITRTMTNSASLRTANTYASWNSNCNPRKVKAKVPNSFLALLYVEAGKYDQDAQYEERSPDGGFGSRPNQYVSGFVDYLSRLIVTLILPSSLSFRCLYFPSWSRNGAALSASLFLLLFSVCVALSSKGSNQDVVLSAVAYAAVIVVFVGQTNT